MPKQYLVQSCSPCPFVPSFPSASCWQQTSLAYARALALAVSLTARLLAKHGGRSQQLWFHARANLLLSCTPWWQQGRRAAETAHSQASCAGSHVPCWLNEGDTTALLCIGWALTASGLRASASRTVTRLLDTHAQGKFRLGIEPAATV